MFKELGPLLRQRSVVMILTRLDDDTIRVNVIPRKLNDSENQALTTPVSVTGTAEDLDAQLPATLSQFVGAHLELKNTLETAKEQMTAAAKTAKSKATPATAPAKTAPVKANSVKPETSKPVNEPAEPVEPRKQEPPKTASLFDFGSVPVPAAPVPAASAPANEAGDEEEEIMAEIAGETEESDEAAA
jgi:PRTRC genetic system protein E